MSNREILFRGKSKELDPITDKHEFVYGYLARKYICENGAGRFDKVIQQPYDMNGVQYFADYFIIPETVGQFTGLTDKNGAKIFEGDIVKTHYANAPQADFVEQVVFHNGKFCAEGTIGDVGKSWAPLANGIKHISQDKSIYMESCETIGNIHDNPELLGGEGT